jgi:hypothetical protein
VATLCRALPFSRGNGDGTFAGPFTLTTLHNPQKVVAGDFDKDGKLDFAVMGTDCTRENSGKSIPLSHGLMIDVVDRTYRFIHTLFDENTGGQVLLSLRLSSSRQPVGMTRLWGATT